MKQKLTVRSKAPLRLGLAGGGSDVSPYSDMYGGLILNATINLYAYTTIEETDDGLITINAFDAQCHKSYPVAERLEIDGEASLVKGVYNRVVKDFGVGARSFKITTYNDAPAGSGLGTSSTMVVSILKAFVEWLGLPLGDYEISRLAYEIERKDLGLSGGKQDQYAAAFGGFNYMEFLQNDIVIVNPLKIKRWIVDELEASMLLYFTGKSRSSAAIIEEQKSNTSKGENDAVEAMHKIKQSAKDMKLAVLKGDVNGFADILREGWENKKKMANNITNPMIQEAMDVAMAAGAKAGKVSGAGGGGFIMFVVEPTRKKEVEEALKKLSGFVMPFQFSDGGPMAGRYMDKHIDTLVQRYPQLDSCKEDILKAYQILEETYAAGRKLLVAGNGGSASDSEHIVGELMKEFRLKRKIYAAQIDRLMKIDAEMGTVLADHLQGTLPAISLVGEPSLTTAFMNDAVPVLIFAQQVNGLGRAGDVFLGISTSGNSKNVLYAAVAAKSKGLKVIGLTGQTENQLERYADVCIHVPETETYKIQELHLPVYHCLCLMLEEKFFG